jgi:hypothetical protein
VRQEFLRRSRRWRDQIGEETSRLRDQFQEVGGRFEERLEGWLEEPDGPDSPRRSPYGSSSPYADRYRAWEAWDGDPDPDPYASRYDSPGDRRPRSRPDPRQRPDPGQDHDSDEDPWI